MIQNIARMETRYSITSSSRKLTSKKKTEMLCFMLMFIMIFTFSCILTRNAIC